MPSHAVAYVRRSNDPHQTRSSVTRQVAYCREMATREGLVLGRVYEDNDLTGTGTVCRPAFEELLSSLGGISVVLSWETDRLFRSAPDQHRLFLAAELAGARVLTSGGWLDPSSDSSWLSAGISAVVGGHSVRQTRRRVRDALASNAAQGLPHGRCPYGWRREWDVEASGRRTFRREVLEPAEAEVIREAARRVLGGEPLHAIACALVANGTPPPESAQWDGRKLWQILIRPRNAGLRVHRGKVVGPGQWPSILTEAVHAALVGKLTDPSRRCARGPAVAHLLSGIAVCGVPGCGEPMRAARGSYRCSTPARHTSRGEHAVDQLIRDVVVGRLSMPDAIAVMTPVETPEDSAVADQLAALAARRDASADAYAAGSLDLASLTRASAQIDRQIAALTPRQHRSAGKPAALSLAGTDAAQSWQRASLEQRRAVVRELLTIRIVPTRKGARTFDPESVEITWR